MRRRGRSIPAFENHRTGARLEQAERPRNIVVLPAPLAPIRHTIVALGDVEVDALTTASGRSRAPEPRTSSSERSCARPAAARALRCRDRLRSRPVSARTASGAPSAILRPKFSTVIRSQRRMTKFMSCSTRSMRDAARPDLAEQIVERRASRPDSCRRPARRAAAVSARRPARGRFRAGADRHRTKRRRACSAAAASPTKASSSRASRTARAFSRPEPPEPRQDLEQASRRSMRMHPGEHVLQRRHLREQPQVLEGAGEPAPGPRIGRKTVDPRAAQLYRAGCRGARPLIALKTLVLPAPFGPISPCRLPRSTRRSRPSIAVRPPYRSGQRLDFELRRAHVALSPTRARCGRCARQTPCGMKRTTMTMMRPLTTSLKSCSGRRTSGSSVRIERAGDRPERRTDAAEQREAQDCHRRVETIFVRADERGDVGVERAGEAREHGGGDQRRELVTRQIDAEHAGGDLILADRLHGAADARAADQDQRQSASEKAAVDQGKPAFVGMPERPSAPPVKSD